jgi:hypothetical protein
MASATKPQRGEKSAFIRQHPTLKASEMIAEAKKVGIKLTATQIYNCRAVDKRKGKKGTRSKRAVNGVASGTEIGHGLVVVAATVKKLGGIENVKQALRLIEQVSGALN